MNTLFYKTKGKLPLKQIKYAYQHIYFLQKQ